MREREVERSLYVASRALGGWAIKLLPSAIGLPDRIVLLPGGRIYFVELKSPTGQLRPAQEAVHRRLADLGFPVAVLKSPQQVTSWVESVTQSSESAPQSGSKG